MGAGDSHRLSGSIAGLLVVAAVVAGCTRDTPAPVEYKTTRAANAPVPDSKPRATAPPPTVGTSRGEAPILEPRYVVRSGDTLYQVARRSGVALRDLIAANELSPPYELRAGDTLQIPAVRYHDVAAGETMHAIAREQQVSLSALVRANAIAPPYEIRVGQRLRLPAPTPAPAAATPPPPRTAAPPPTPTAKAADVRTGDAAPRPAHKPSRQTAAIPKPPKRSGSQFAWPAEGRVISRFGPKQGGLHNDGINIALPAGAPVRAAESGVVAYTGNEVRGFGNLILLRHDGGWVSAYGHNDEILVQVGDVVRRGEKLATAGSSGGVGRTQLHFELRRGREAVDPMRYLTRLSATPGSRRTFAASGDSDAHAPGEVLHELPGDPAVARATGHRPLDRLGLELRLVDVEAVVGAIAPEHVEELVLAAVVEAEPETEAVR